MGWNAEIKGGYNKLWEFRKPIAVDKVDDARVAAVSSVTYRISQGELSSRRPLIPGTARKRPREPQPGAVIVEPGNSGPGAIVVEPGNSGPGAIFVEHANPWDVYGSESLTREVAAI